MPVIQCHASTHTCHPVAGTSGKRNVRYARVCPFLAASASLRESFCITSPTDTPSCRTLGSCTSSTVRKKATAARGQPTLDAIVAAGTSVNRYGNVDSEDPAAHTSGDHIEDNARDQDEVVESEGEEELPRGSSAEGTRQI